jgi:hypothetical protein
MSIAAGRTPLDIVGDVRMEWIFGKHVTARQTAVGMHFSCHLQQIQHGKGNLLSRTRESRTFVL